MEQASCGERGNSRFWKTVQAWGPNPQSLLSESNQGFHLSRELGLSQIVPIRPSSPPLPQVMVLWLAGCMLLSKSGLQLSRPQLSHITETRVRISPFGLIQIWIRDLVPIDQSIGIPDLVPGSGRSPGEGNGNPLQYSLPGKSYGQRSLLGCRVRKSQTWLSDWSWCAWSLRNPMCNLFYFLVQGPNLDLVFPDRDQPCPPIVIHFPFFNVFGYAKIFI